MPLRINRLSRLPEWIRHLWIRKNGPVVLYYHGVAERVIDPLVESLPLPLQKFDEHIQYLRKNYSIISMDEFAELQRKRRLNSSHLLLTFDDGYKNNLTTVAPYLK